MRYNIEKRPFLQVIPIMLIALLGVGCSGSDHEGAVGTERMEQGTIRGDGTVEADGQDSKVDADGGVNTDRNDAVVDTDEGDMSEKEITLEERKARDEQERTADEQLSPERRTTLTELREVRTRMEDELAAVRERLRDGTRTPEDRNADQALAAELGRDLQRLEQVREEIRSANDEDWAKKREEHRKEIGELRTRLDRADPGQG